MLLSTDHVSDEALEALHPSHAHTQILWQIYLENVHPICQILHPPSFQRHIIEYAQTSLRGIPKSQLALQFSIYTFAVATMTNTECEKKLDLPRAGLLKQLQYGTRQALGKRQNLLIDRD